MAFHKPLDSDRPPEVTSFARHPLLGTILWIFGANEKADDGRVGKKGNGNSDEDEGGRRGGGGMGRQPYMTGSSEGSDDSIPSRIEGVGMGEANPIGAR